MYPRAGDDPRGFIFRTGKPADVIAALKHALKFVAGLNAKGFKQFQRKFAHVFKHAGAMATTSAAP